MNRELEEVELPISKGVAKIVPYFTRGEEMKIREALIKDATLRLEGKESITDGFSLSNQSIAEGLALQLGIKELILNGKSVEVTVEAIDNLPAEDADLIVQRLNKAKKK